ncbi:MAG: SpoVA/SpoVAEb family sporulation membrane protein [Lachnospiraceae bacterium]|nr:SpoVA/SpoVAEb family sporulation membrane protein [Lachnospiraceae bacterium]
MDSGINKNENSEETVFGQKYSDYVKGVTPTTSLSKNMFWAFVVGGSICLMGQVILEVFKAMGVGQEDAAAYTTIILILESVILTALNVYPVIGKIGGAGALVPITGFANSVAAPAVEFGVEGQVYGVGVRIFSIAGPVILYGIFSSWIFGIIYLLAGDISLF